MASSEAAVPRIVGKLLLMENHIIPYQGGWNAGISGDVNAAVAPGCSTPSPITGLVGLDAPRGGGRVERALAASCRTCDD
jgi:hypothetical protein